MVNIIEILIDEKIKIFSVCNFFFLKNLILKKSSTYIFVKNDIITNNNSNKKIKIFFSALKYNL